MVERVILGNKGGSYGLWVSKPGVSVLTASDWEMLFVSDSRSVRMLASGVVNVPASSSAFSQTVTLPITAPTNSGILAGTKLISNGRLIEGIGSYFSLTFTSTNATFTKVSGVTVQFDIVWHLIAEIGGVA